MSELMLG